MRHDPTLSDLSTGQRDTEQSTIQRLYQSGHWPNGCAHREIIAGLQLMLKTQKHAEQRANTMKSEKEAQEKFKAALLSGKTGSCATISSDDPDKPVAEQTCISARVIGSLLVVDPYGKMDSFPPGALEMRPPETEGVMSRARMTTSRARKTRRRRIEEGGGLLRPLGRQGSRRPRPPKNASGGSF